MGASLDPSIGWVMFSASGMYRTSQLSPYPRQVLAGRALWFAEEADVRVAPTFQGKQDRFHAAPESGHRIFPFRGHLSIDRAHDESVLFQLAQLIGQHARGDVNDVVAEFIEP